MRAQVLTCKKYSIFVGSSPLTFIKAKSDIPKTNIAILLPSVLSCLYSGATNPLLLIIKCPS